MKKLYTLMLITLLAPFLLANQTIDVNVPYVMTFVDNSGYDLDTGAVISDTDFARTDKKINRNSIIYVNDYELFTYVLFYDNLDQYIGYYTTTNSELYETNWITAISSNEFSPPSNAYYFAYMIDKVTQNIDTTIADLNNLSLREVFETGNLVTNGDFSNGTTSWSIGSNITSSLNNNIFSFVGAGNTNNFNQIVTQYHSISNSNIYVNAKARSIDAGTFLLNTRLTFANQYSQILSNNFSNVSHIFLSDSTNNRIAFGGFVGFNFDVDYIYAINLTSLGLTALTKEQMDYYFALYQNNPNIIGITYSTFDDLTTTYRQTFYDPLPSNSIALIVSGILAIGLILLGFITRARIFNLFSIAPFIVIAIMLPEPAIIIAMIGMIIWQLYYTFRMD